MCTTRTRRISFEQDNQTLESAQQYSSPIAHELVRRRVKVYVLLYNPIGPVALSRALGCERLHCKECIQELLACPAMSSFMKK